MTKLKLDQNAKRRFLKLVDDINSHNNGTRVVARIRMRSFTDKYGEAECREFFEAYNARAKARKS